MSERMSAFGTKQTSPGALHMSAFAVKRTSLRLVVMSANDRFRHSATAVESPLDGLLLSPRRKAYQPK